MPTDAEVTIPNEQNIAPKGYTKQGNHRKRAPPRQKNKILSKRQRNQDKHDIQPPCGDPCKRKCVQKISQERRETMQKQFWLMEENERKMFVLGHVNKSKVSRRTTEEEPKRGNTFIYHLTSTEGDRLVVCKTFFFLLRWEIRKK